MRSLILAAAAAATLSLAAAGADAMPAGPIAGSQAPEVILVAGGCGPAFHRGPYGGCVRNFYRPIVRPVYGYYAAPVYRPWARCGVRVGPLAIGTVC